MAKRSLPRKLLHTTGEHFLGWGFWSFLRALWRLFVG
jgi:hypothetical protein